MQTHKMETQLGLIDLFSAIWSQKWVILALFILGTILSFIFATNISSNLKISAEIDELPGDSSIELRRLRNVALLPYSERDMLIRYARYLRDTDIVDRAARESTLGSLNLDGQESDVFINSLVRSLNIDPKIRSLGEDTQLYYVLSFSNSNIDKTIIESFITNLLHFSNEKLVSELLNEISSRVQDKENAVAWEIISLNEKIENLNRLHIANIDDAKARIIIEIDKLKEEHHLVLEDKITGVQNDMKRLRTRDAMELEDTIGDKGLIINRAKSEYALKKNDRIYFLQEQLEIAEALGIEQPSDMGQIVPENAAIASVRNSDGEPYYYRGSIAINKEIEEISGRVYDDSFVPSLRKLESDLDYLEKKRNDDRFVQGIRKLESDLFLLQVQRDNDSYIVGLRDLQIESDMLDIQRENLAFVEGVNTIKQQIVNLENDIELSIARKTLKDVESHQNEIKFVSYDERKSVVNNVSGRQKKLTLILGSGASGMVALLIGLLIWSIKRSYSRES